MADSKQFVLIGSFDDQITPSLARINRQLASLNNSFKSFGGKGARKTARDVGKFSVAVNSLNENLKIQNQAMRAAIAPMREYRREVGKTVRALTRLTAASGDVRAIEATNRALMRQARLHAQLNTMRNRRSGTRTMAAPGGGGGGRRMGGGGAGPGGFHMAEFGFAYTLGSNLARPIESAILSGFQLGVQLMIKPFQYFVNNFGERVQDELSDLKAAGGFFSLSQGQKPNERLVKTFDEAVDFTQENNKVLAQLAAALPGVTQDYIEVSKRISDSVARVVIKDQGKAIAYAQQLQKADPTVYKDAVKDQKGAVQVMLGELTKQTVLAGLGGRAGAGGAKGAYGLPQLTERMLTQQEVSIGQFQRYSAIFSDPMVMDALQKEIPNINKTAAASLDRYKALRTLFERVVPPELVERYKRTVAGVTETFQTAIFGPETGLFGLGRKMEGLGDKFDEFGRVVKDASGKVEKAELSLYDMVRDVIANLGQVFAPFVENITKIFDPLRKVGEILSKARTVSAKLLESFNIYLQGFKDLGFAGGEASLRASLTTIGNLLRYMKVIGEGDFASLVDKLKSKGVKFGPIMKDLLDKLLNSEVAKKIGKTIGEIIGTVLTEVANMTGFISGRIASSNQLFAGLKEGFTAAGGTEAIKNIFKDVLTSVFKVLGQALSIMPLEIGVIAAVMAVIPALAQGLGMWIATQLLGLPKALAGQSMAGEIAAGAGGGRRGGIFGPTAAMQRKRMRAMARASRAAKAARDVGQFGVEAAGLGYNLAGRPGAKALGALGRVGKVARYVPGGAMVGGALSAAGSLASGEGFGKAAAGAFGSVLLGTAGSIFGPAGTIIGGIAGDMIGKAVYSAAAYAFTGPSEAQRTAARAQEFAAAAMKPVSTVSTKDIGPVQDYLGTGVVGLSQFNKAVKYAGLESNQATTAYMNQARVLSDLKTKYQALNDEAFRQKQLSGGRVDTGLQARLKAARDALVAGEQATAAAWAKVTTGHKTKIDNAIVQLQTNANAFNVALLNQTNKISTGMVKAKLKIDQIESLSSLLPPVPSKPVPKIVPRYSGGLSDAIASEMRNKPRGSNLVVANSSETIIPAAGGYGMKNFLGQVKMAVASANRTSGGGTVTVNAPITIHQQAGQNPEELAAIVARELWNAVAETQRSTMFV